MKHLFTLYFLLIPLSLSAQDGDLKLNRTFFSCSYYGEEVNGKIKSFKSVDSAYAIIQSIVNIVGLKPNFEVRPATIPNAAAVIYQGKRYVLYNSRFINMLSRATGYKWAAVSILAHEVGHHLNGHTLAESGSRPDIELEADEFSGFVMRKMGASIVEAQAAIRMISSIKASHTHPGRSDRLKAIAAGWNNADVQMAGRMVPPKTNTNAEVPVIASKPPKRELPVLQEKYIAFEVYFDADPDGNYFVTIRNNLVKVEADKLYAAGVMVHSNRKHFAAMFYDKQYNYLYITKDLDIVNGEGKRVGFMKRRR